MFLFFIMVNTDLWIIIIIIYQPYEGGYREIVITHMLGGILQTNKVYFYNRFSCFLQFILVTLFQLHHTVDGVGTRPSVGVYMTENFLSN